MAKYRPIDLRLWSDRKFLALGDDARLLWMFLLTTPATLPIPGVIVAGEAALAEQLGWTVERFTERFRELAQSGLAVRREGRVWWLQNALRYQQPANPNTVKCWAKSWDDVPEGGLKREIWEALRDACRGWSRLFAGLFAEPRNGSNERTVPGTVTPETGRVNPSESERFENGSRNGSKSSAATNTSTQRNGSANGSIQDQDQEQDQDQDEEERASSSSRRFPNYEADAKRGALAEIKYAELSRRRLALAAELGLPTPLPYPAIVPNRLPKGFQRLRERLREEGDLAAVVIDAMLDHLECEARDKADLYYFDERSFAEDAWRNARSKITLASSTTSAATTIAGARRPPRSVEVSNTGLAIFGDEFESIMREVEGKA